MPTFAGGGRVVEAVRYTGTNLAEVCIWINVEDEDAEVKGYYKDDNVCLIRFTDGSAVYLAPGEWLVHRGGKFVSVPDDHFQNTYHFTGDPLDEPTDEPIPEAQFAEIEVRRDWATPVAACIGGLTGGAAVALILSLLP